MIRYLTIAWLTLSVLGCQKTFFVDKTDDPVFIFNSFWNEIDRNYSYFQYHQLNWDSVYQVYKSRITANTTNDSLFKLIGQVTNLLHDAHTNLYTPMGIAGNIYYFDAYPSNQITLDTAVYFEYYHTGKILEVGKLKKKNIGYIKIKTFEGESKNFEAIDSFLQTLTMTDGLIIDVRSNFGGDISNSKIVAARFIDSSRYICKYRARNGQKHDDFSDWIDVTINPSPNGMHFKKPLVILTNRTSYSATEWFVLFVRGRTNVTTVGDTTGGGSAIPIIRELPNGCLLRISNTQVLLPSGLDFQNCGLCPDIPIWITQSDREKDVDTILEKAILFLTDNTSSKYKVIVNQYLYCLNMLLCVVLKFIPIHPYCGRPYRANMQ